MAATPSKLFLILAGFNTIIAIGHTFKGLGQFKDMSLQKLPVLLRETVKIGWYEGSVFFAIMGLLNYKWAQIGPLDIYDRGIAGLYVSMCVGAGSGYAINGDMATALILAVAGTLQSIAAYNG